MGRPLGARPALQPIGCVTLGESVDFSGPWFLNVMIDT